jgi:hypothetical protein
VTPQTLVTEDGQRITVVHFCEYLEVDDLERLCTVREERVACLPNARDLTAKDRAAPVIRTPDPRIVNCPLCQTTDGYKAALEEAKRVSRRRSPRVA